MTPRGQEIVVSEPLDFGMPDVAPLGIGGLTSCYHSFTGFPPPNVFGQVFADDSPQATEFVVSTTTTPNQEDCAIASAPDGCFVTVWTQGNVDSDLFAQRFCQTGFVAHHSVNKVNGGNDLKLTWDNVPGATSYTVYQDSEPNGPFVSLAGFANDGTVGLTVPMPPGNRYYRVAAVSPSGGEGSRY